MSSAHAAILVHHSIPTRPSPSRPGQRCLRCVEPIRLVLGAMVVSMHGEAHRLLGHLALVHVPRRLVEVRVRRQRRHNREHGIRTELCGRRGVGARVRATSAQEAEWRSRAGPAMPGHASTSLAGVRELQTLAPSWAAIRATDGHVTLLQGADELRRTAQDLLHGPDHASRLHSLRPCRQTSGLVLLGSRLARRFHHAPPPGSRA